MDKLVEGQSICIINHVGKVETDYIVSNPKVDRQGLIAVSKDGCIMSVHPKRIVTGEIEEKSIMADPTSSVEVQTEQLQLSVELEAEAPTPKPTKAVKSALKQPKVAPTKVDIGVIAASGELWVKAGIDFDGRTEVNTYCLLIADKGQYMSFNTYNGTFGKKGKGPPIDEIKAGANAGYAIKDATKLRDKLVKTGYKKYGG